MRILVTAAAAAGTIVALTACDRATSGEPEPVAIAAAAAGQEEPPVTVSLNAAEIDGLGKVLTDQDGMTLYRFDRDRAEPSMSNCDSECVADWPPALADGEVVVAGVNKSLVDSVPRVDGNRQLTIAGWPLYRFAGDRKPGDAAGHGVGGVWFAVAPDGEKAGAAPARLVGRNLPGFGAALTDQDGFTLYLFTNDSKEPSRSACYDECAELWPPVLAGGAEPELAGVDPAIVGEVAREDGTRQLTVGGWPVYRYAEDAAPGETGGHGVGGTWYVIEPAGCKSLAPVRK